MGFYRGPNIVRDNLLIHVDAASYRSYTTDASAWNDLTTNGYNAAKTGSITYVSTEPQHYDIANDAGDWDFGDIEELNLTDCTFSIWFKLDVLNADQVLFSKGTFATTEALTIWFDVSVAGGDVGSGNTSTIDVVVHDGSITHRISAPTDTINSTSKIYCLDVVLKPSTNDLSIYVDGDLKVSNTKTWNGMENNTSSFKIGGSTSVGYGIDGELYAARVYTKALTAEEILQNFNAQRERYGI